MYAVVQVLLASALVTSCFNLPVKSTATTTVLNSEARPAVAKALSEVKTVSAYDPNSKVETSIQPPSGALSGSKITLPAGALAIAVDLVVEESIPMAETSVVSSLNLREDIKIQPIGAGLIIRPSANVDLTKPLTIAMSLESIGGLRTWLKSRLSLAPNTYYAVFYKSMIKGELRAGVIPTSELLFSEDNQVLFEGYFGAFWLCEVSSPIEERVEVRTNDPTVNANRVAVIESTGIVSEETITAKAAIPEVVWSAVNMSFDSALRTAQITSSIASGPSLVSCQVDLRIPNDSSAGTNRNASIDLIFSFPVTKKESHIVSARFRCLDKQGRLTLSAWSPNLSIPAEPDPAVATALSINGGSDYTKSSQVSLTLAATGATAMYITESSDCANGGSWESYAPSKVWTLTPTNAKATVYAKFRNSLGKESSCINSSIIHDNQPPTASSMSINGNAAATSGPAVTLTFTVFGAQEMYITSSSGCSANGNWESFAASKSWTLAQSTGSSTVYAKFRDPAGNESSCISASISQNSSGPTATSISISYGAAATTATNVMISLYAMGATEMYLTNTAGCGSGGSWTSYSSMPYWTLAQTNATATVYVKFRNALGTESTCISDSIIQNSTPPTTSSLAVVGGSEFTCALLSGGIVKCWGAGGSGQLGQENYNFIGNAPGQMESQLPPIRLGTGRTAVSIAAGEQHACAILDDGTVKCWGFNYYGSLGNGTSQSRGANAGDMGDSLAAVDLGTGRTAKQISASYYHTCAVLDNNSVKCWGFNAWGQLGLGDATNRGTSAASMGEGLPVVDLGTNRTAKFVATGWYFTCALLDNNSVKCWGHNNQGMLGRGDTTQIGDEPGEMGDSLAPVNLGSSRSAKALIAGERFACAILDNDALKCWGQNINGELGTGTYGSGNSGYVGPYANDMGNNLVSTDLGTNLYAVKLAASFQTCALLNNGSVKCWGANGSGQLGQGDSSNRGNAANQMGVDLPSIDLGTGRTALAIGTGHNHSCAVLDDTSIKCWGGNSSGQLGQGNTTIVGNQGGQMGGNLAAIPLAGIPNSGLKLWLRADSDLFQDISGTTPAIATGDPIALWKDRSGNSGDMFVHANLNPSTARPELNGSALSGKPAISFNGASNLSNLVNYPYPNTIFILGRYTGGSQGRIISGTNNNWLMGWYNGLSSAFFAEGWVNYGSSSATTAWVTYSTDQTATTQRIFQSNSLMQSASLGNTQGPDGLSLGGWSTCCGEYSAAEVAEVIVYDRVLSDAERTAVYSYLNSRYAPGN